MSEPRIVSKRRLPQFDTTAMLAATTCFAVAVLTIVERERAIDLSDGGRDDFLLLVHLLPVRAHSSALRWARYSVAGCKAQSLLSWRASPQAACSRFFFFSRDVVVAARTDGNLQLSTQ
jgi:hypothetical protein